MSTKGAKSKKKNDDWVKCRDWLVQVMTQLEFSSVKTPSIKLLNGEYELYNYLKVKYSVPSVPVYCIPLNLKVM